MNSRNKWHVRIHGKKRDRRLPGAGNMLSKKREPSMELTQVSESCFAVINPKNRLCDVNSGLVNRGGGLVIDTQPDLQHARRMRELFGGVWPAPSRRVVNTHADLDHVWGNQLFADAEIIGHRSIPKHLPQTANPRQLQWLTRATRHVLIRVLLNWARPGVAAMVKQLSEDYDFAGIHLVPPTTLLDERYELDLDGVEVHLIYLGPCHQAGDTIVHLPKEGVVFAGDLVFRECTPIGWRGTYDNWLNTLALIENLRPTVIVPGHGPIREVNGLHDMANYLRYVRDEARRFHELGYSALQAAQRIEFGPYATWRAPARLYMNVARAYREFQGVASDAPWNIPQCFQAMYQVARHKGISIEF